MSLRSVVHRCPAVPTAENTVPFVARSKSAEDAITVALLPPQLQQGAAEPRGDTTRDLPAHPGGPGRTDQGHPQVINDLLADRPGGQQQTVHIDRPTDVLVCPREQTGRGQGDGKLADIDHLLDFAQCLGANFAHFSGDQVGQVTVVLTDQLAKPADELTAARRWGGTPHPRPSNAGMCTRSEAATLDGPCRTIRPGPAAVSMKITARPGNGRSGGRGRCRP